MTFLWQLTFVILGSSGFASSVVGPDISRMAELFRDHFSSPRQPVGSSSSHLATKNFITNELRSYGLELHLQPFNTSIQGLQMQGTNVIGILKGKFWNSTYDHILVIGAHYDTEEHDIGVDDNGSGVVAMLEVARLMTRIAAAGECELQYSVMFVAFDCGFHDFERNPYELKGSSYFIGDWLEPILLSHLSPSFIGAFILDSVLVWNNTSASQILPEGFQRMFPAEWHQIQRNGFRGDFLAMVNRGVADDCLTTSLLHWWLQENQHPTTALLNLHLDLELIPTPQVALEFLKQDHAEFWNAEVGEENAPLPAVLLTDTGVWRGGRGRGCSHRCDSLEQVTDETLAFLSLLIRCLVNLISESHCIYPSQNNISSLSDGMFLNVYAFSISFTLRWIV